MAFLDSDGPLDLVLALFGFQYAMCWYVAFAWEVEAAQKLVVQMITCFGLLPVAQGELDLAPGQNDPWVVCGAAMVLPLATVFIPRFVGTENSVGRHHRQMVTFWCWFGYLLYHLRLYVLRPENHPFAGTTCNAAWIVFNALATLVHFQWVGRDLGAKLKLS